jgi:hypothetical protein
MLIPYSRENLICPLVTAFDGAAAPMFVDGANESGASSDMTRLILFAKYGF